MTAVYYIEDVKNNNKRKTLETNFSQKSTLTLSVFYYFYNASQIYYYTTTHHILCVCLTLNSENS